MSSLDFNDALPLCLAPNTETLGRVVQPLWSSEPCPSRAALGRDSIEDDAQPWSSPSIARRPPGFHYGPGDARVLQSRKSVRI